MISSYFIFWSVYNRSQKLSNWQDDLTQDACQTENEDGNPLNPVLHVVYPPNSLLTHLPLPPAKKKSSFHFSRLLTLEDKAPIHQRWHSQPPRESWASRTDWTCCQKCWSLFYTISLSWRLSVNTLSVIKTSEFSSAAKLLFRKCSFRGNAQRRICRRSQLFCDITPIDLENDKNDSHHFNMKVSANYAHTKVENFNKTTLKLPSWE